VPNSKSFSQRLCHLLIV